MAITDCFGGKHVFRTLILGLAAVLSAESAVVYSNTTTDLGLQDVFSDAGVTEIGDQISLLLPGPRQLQSVTAALVSYSDAVTVDVILRIYAVDAGNVGSLLGSSTLTGVSFAPDSRQVLTFTGWSLTLPNELIWTLGFGGDASPVLGVEVYSPPGTGSSDASFAWWGVSGSFTQQSFPGIDNNYFLEIDAADSAAVPEVGSAGAVLVGLALVLLGRTKFCRRA